MKIAGLQMIAALYLCIVVESIYALPSDLSKGELALLNGTNIPDILFEESDQDNGPLQSGGVVYTRWGSQNCSSTRGTKPVYSGMAGKAYYNDKGGGVDFQCLPRNPQFYEDFRPGAQGYAEMYGVEYESPITGTQNHNMPCAVCYVLTRNVQLMIPARFDCPDGWTKEYSGYLMSGHHDYPGSTTFVCVDHSQQSLPGSSDNSNGALVYHVEPICNLPGFPCPPYDNQKELSCVVCTK